MNAAQIIRAAIPEADDVTVEHVVWGRTCYPFGRVTPRDLYRAASRMVRAGRNGIQLCDWCDRPAVDKWTCASCAASLSTAKQGSET